MKATELRIGSTYRSVKFDMTVTLCAEDMYELVCKADGASIDFYIDGMIEPIPLTEEWLLKFGFKPFVKDFTKNGIIIHTRKRGYVLRKSVPIIKYVHQLQNLYFALTGEELA